MPEEQEQYYGFTQFAMELNELDSSLRPLLPPTDTRLRPDQRSAPLLCDHCYTTTTTTTYYCYKYYYEYYYKYY